MRLLPWNRVVLHILLLFSVIQMTKVTGHDRNSDIPEWKQRACEKAQKNRANSHYICDDKGNVKCLPGWQGDLCQVPMCRKGCDPMNGYCQRPGECRCRIGFTGEFCDKCIPLPGCQHGYCTRPFECLCKPGWDGLFCTEPTCRSGCHSTRGYCENPGECRCRIGWAGRNCSDCSVLPGCQHGTCSKPLECKCMSGYTGLLCQTALCSEDCHKQHGYCRRPGECRCRVGWTGEKCDKCFPYPGCVNGDCQQPWECNCRPSWGGILCDEKLTYCDDHPESCENGGKCISLTKADGSYRCHCKQGYLGKNCEILDEFMLTSTAPPRITPPSLPITEEHEEQLSSTPQSVIDRIDVGKTSKNNNNSTTTKIDKKNDTSNEDDDDDDDDNGGDDDDEEDEDDDEYEDDEEDLEDVNGTEKVDKKKVAIGNVTTTTPTTTKAANLSIPATTMKPLKIDADDDKHTSAIGNAIDDDGFARRRNGGGLPFVFPTLR